MTSDRGQVYTLEGVIAALIVLAGLLFALQATTTTPQTSGISNPQAQAQDRALLQDVLTTANGSTLREAVLYWDASGGTFHCTPGIIDYYPAPNTSQTDAGSGGCADEDDLRAEWAPPTPFGGLLAQHFGSGYSYNVYVAYHDTDDDGNLSRQRMVYQGQPGDGVVRASTSVALANDTRLYEEDLTRSPSTTVSDTGFYATQSSSDPPRVVYLEVLVWQG